MPQSVPGVSAGAWITAILFLGVLAAGGYFLVRWVKRLQGGGEKDLAGVRVLARLPLSMNHSMAVVEMVDHVLVVGVGDGVTLIERIDDRSVVRTLMTESGPATGPFAAFRREQAVQADFRRLFDETLSRIRQRSASRKEGGTPHA